MATISVSLPSDGQTIDAADYNTPINTIVNEINGNLDNANIKTGAAIATAKLATDAGIATGMIADAAVTPAKRSGGFKIDTFTINANGSQSVTGLGFTPKYIEIELFDGNDFSGTTIAFCKGGYDGTTAWSVGGRAVESGDISGTVSSTFMGYVPTTNQTRSHTIAPNSLDADGFTFTVASAGTNKTYLYKAFG